MPTLLEQITKAKSPLSTSTLATKKQKSPLNFLTKSVSNITFPEVGLTLQSAIPKQNTVSLTSNNQTTNTQATKPVQIGKQVNTVPVPPVQTGPTATQIRPATPPISFLRETGGEATNKPLQSEDDILKSIVTKQKKELYPSLTSQEIDFLVNQDINRAKLNVEEKENALKAQRDREEQLRLQEETRLSDLLKQETEKRARNTSESLSQYQAQLDEIYRPQIARVEQAGKERTAIRERLAGVAGNLTTATGVQALEEISRDTENAVNAINAAKRLELSRKEAELRGADEETLNAISNQLGVIKQKQQVLTANLEDNLAQLKFDAIEIGDQQKQQLIQNSLDSLSAKKIESFDEELTKTINDGFLYSLDSDGVPSRVKDSEGKEITIIGDDIVNIGGRPFDTKKKAFLDFQTAVGGEQELIDTGLTRKEKDTLNANIRKTDEYKSLTKLTPVLEAINNFKKTWEGTNKEFVFTGQTAGVLAGAYNNMITQLKEFYNLGALTGPDEGILKKTVPDPTSPVSLRFGAGTIDLGLENIQEALKNTIQNREKALIEQFGFYNDLEALKTVQREVGNVVPNNRVDLQDSTGGLDDFYEFIKDANLDIEDTEALNQAYDIYNSSVESFNKSLSKDEKGDDLSKITMAIGQYESGNNYKALGPVIPSGTYKGDRALGKYQVMGKNLPQWSKETVGRVVSKEEFLQNPQLQDKIANFKLGQIFSKYGNLEDTASVWFTGQPTAKSKGKKDLATGVSSENYIKNIRNIYNKLS